MVITNHCAVACKNAFTTVTLPPSISAFPCFSESRASCLFVKTFLQRRHH